MNAITNIESMDFPKLFNKLNPMRKRNSNTSDLSAKSQSSTHDSQISAEKRPSLSSTTSSFEDISTSKNDKQETYIRYGIVSALGYMADMAPVCLQEVKRENTAEFVKIQFKCNDLEEDLEIKIYSPESFSHLFQKDQYLNMMSSFTSQFTKTQAGKSGSALFWSNNKKFIAKTLTNIEIQKAKMILPKLCAYQIENPDSYIVKHALLARIKFGSQSFYFIVMENLYYDFQVATMFDLKGSTYGRLAKTNGDIMKDLDFERRNEKLFFESEKNCRDFFNTIRKDVKFLTKNGRIDYSLLVSFDTQYKWKCGIIDVLTPFAAHKVLEYFSMGLVRGFKSISCAPPKFYSSRFYQFMEKSVSIVQPVG